MKKKDYYNLGLYQQYFAIEGYLAKAVKAVGPINVTAKPQSHTPVLAFSSIIDYKTRELP